MRRSNSRCRSNRFVRRSQIRKALMRILFLTSANNSLSQRLWIELCELGHDVSVRIAVNSEGMISTAFREQPDLIIAPKLRVAIRTGSRLSRGSTQLRVQRKSADPSTSRSRVPSGVRSSMLCATRRLTQRFRQCKAAVRRIGREFARVRIALVAAAARSRHANGGMSRSALWPSCSCRRTFR